jgi:hypothetical protein
MTLDVLCSKPPHAWPHFMDFRLQYKRFEEKLEIQSWLGE